MKGRAARGAVTVAEESGWLFVVVDSFERSFDCLMKNF
jgi:hypothetical protein